MVYLSVDIDLNYIGNADRDVMLIERPLIQSAITAICEGNGLTLDSKLIENIKLHPAIKWSAQMVKNQKN